MGKIRRLVIYTDKIKQQKRMVVYSDLHLGFNKFNNLAQVLASSELSPDRFDCILMPGDIVHSASSLKDETVRKTVLDDLRILTGATPVYYSLGNHDLYSRYGFEKWGYETELRLNEVLEELGNFHELKNGTVLTDGEVALKGRSNPASYYLDKKESVASFWESYNSLGSNEYFSNKFYNILLVHDPKGIYQVSKYLKGCLEENTDLVVSGHMHNALIPNFLQGILGGRGIISPNYQLGPEFAYGVRDIGDTLFLINGAINPMVESTVINNLYGFNCTEITLEPSENTKRLVYTYK